MQKNRWRRKLCFVFLAIIGIGISVLVSGCAKEAELEDREFILSLGLDLDDDGLVITYDISKFYKEGSNSGSEGGQQSVQVFADGFYDIGTAYGHQSDKYLDYNHLKAIVIGKELASNQKKLIELLQYVEKNDLFARNVKLFIAEEKASDVFLVSEKLPVALGEYLENLYLNSNYFVEEQSVSIGDLMTHWHNYDETLLVPILKEEKEKPVIGGYGVLQQVEWKEELTEEEGNLVFLGNGVKLKTHVAIEDSYVVQFDKITRELTFSEEGAPSAKLSLKMRGRVIDQKLPESRIKIELQEKLEGQLQESFATLIQKWQPKGVDFFHTFSALGSRNRKMWLQYRDQRQVYNSELQMEVEVTVRLLDD